MSEQMLPCPFCGSDAIARDAASGRQNWIECVNRDCGGMGPNRGTPFDAVKGWNRRTAEAGLRQALDVKDALFKQAIVERDAAVAKLAATEVPF